MRKYSGISLVFLILMYLTTLASGQVLFSDTFTGRDGARPAYWQIIDAPETGFWYLKNGEFTTGNCDDIQYSYAVVNIPEAYSWSDYTVQCTAWVPQLNGSVMLMGRWLDKNNFYEGMLEVYQGKRVLRINKVLNGERFMLSRIVDGQQGVSIPPIEQGVSPADRRSLSLTLAGNRLTFTYEGISVSATDESFKQGTAGLGEWCFFVYFDNFIVSSLAPAPAKPVVAPEMVTPVPTPEEPTPAPTAPVYRLVIGEGLEKDVAEGLKNQLLYWGYQPVEMELKGNKYDVYLGSFLTQLEANTAQQRIAGDGLVVQGIATAAGKVEELLAPAPVAPEVGEIYRILVQQVDDQPLAGRLKDTLESDGYVAIDIIPENNKFNVYTGTFANRDEADKWLKVLNQDGYILAKVVAMAREKAVVAEMPPAPEVTAPGFVLPDEITKLTAWQTLTAEEKERVLRTIKAEQLARTGSLFARELEVIKQQIQELTEEQKRLLSTVRDKFEEDRKKQEILADIFRSVDEEIDKGQWSQALALLDKAKEIDPTHPRIELKTKAIERLQKNIKFEGQEEIEAMFKQQMERARSLAQENEARKNYEAAIANWEFIRSRTEPVSLDYQEATREVNRLNSILASVREKEESKRRLYAYVPYGLFALVVIVIILMAFVIINLLRARKRDAEILSQIQQIAVRPMMELEEAKEQKELPQAVKVAPEREEEEMAATKGEERREIPEQEIPMAVPVPEEETREEEIAPAGKEEEEVIKLVETEEPEEKKQVSEEPAAEAVSLSDLERIFGETERREKEKGATSPGEGEVTTIDELLTPEVSEEPREQPLAEAEKTSVISEAELPPEVKKARETAGVLEEGKEENIIFQQDFDDLPEGQRPENWQGDYDYAQLIVTSEKPAPNSKQCLKYQKKAGAGSAFYFCHFPDATGKVVVEFDICCDNKNKYLLGFYIEKDLDFRQSVHTIVHRSEGQTTPSIRIQGEPVAYMLGSWKHIKYVIDLKRGTVDGYVDNKLVASNVKLINCPPKLNTLSIRDNLATTGILKVDNIKVYPAPLPF